MAVEVDYLPHLVGGEREHIGHIPLVKREPHSPHQHVGLHQICQAVAQIQRLAHVGQPLAGVDVGGCLKVDAAFELAALPSQLLRVEGQVLAAGRGGGDGFEVRYELGAAQGPAAYAQAADEPRLLAGADLLHLYPDVELFRKVLDELAEVHAFVCNVVEDGLGAVSLELHVADLHLEAEAGRQLARAYHCAVFARYGLLPVLHIQSLGLAVDFLELVGLGIDAAPCHLAQHHGAAEGHYAQVVAVGRLHNHQVARLELLPGIVAENHLAGVLEADFVVFPVFFGVQIVQIVKVGELAAARFVVDLQQSGVVALHPASAGAVESIVVVVHCA